MRRSKEVQEVVWFRYDSMVEDESEHSRGSGRLYTVFKKSRAEEYILRLFAKKKGFVPHIFD